MNGAWLVNMALWLALVLAVVALAGLRIAGFKSQAYQACAHLFTGYLIGCAVQTRLAIYAVLVVGLSVVEVAVFVRDRLRTGAR